MRTTTEKLSNISTTSYSNHSSEEQTEKDLFQKRKNGSDLTKLLLKNTIKNNVGLSYRGFILAPSGTVKGIVNS